MRRQPVSTLTHTTRQVAEHFLKDPSLYHKTVRMPASVIFCDLQGFTTTVEKLGDDLDRLKEHLEQAMELLESQGRKVSREKNLSYGDEVTIEELYN